MQCPAHISKYKVKKSQNENKIKKTKEEKKQVKHFMLFWPVGDSDKRSPTKRRFESNQNPIQSHYLMKQKQTNFVHLEHVLRVGYLLGKQ